MGIQAMAEGLKVEVFVESIISFYSVVDGISWNL